MHSRIFKTKIGIPARFEGSSRLAPSEVIKTYIPNPKEKTENSETMKKEGK